MRHPTFPAPRRLPLGRRMLAVHWVPRRTPWVPRRQPWVPPLRSGAPSGYLDPEKPEKTAGSDGRWGEKADGYTLREI